MRLFPLPQRIVLTTVLLNSMFFIPVAVLYYKYKGLDVGDIFVALAVYRLLMMAFEVPAGYLADRWQRHHQLMLAGALFVVTYIGIFLADSYWTLLVAFAIAAFGDALFSGTNEAYMHEALRNEGRAHEGTKWQGRLFAGLMIGEAVAALLGGWMYNQWVEMPVLVTVFTACVGLLIMLTYPPVPRVGTRRHEDPIQDLKAVMRWSLREHPRLPWLITAPRLLFALTGVLYWAMQTQMTLLEVAPMWLGIALAGYYVSKTIAASVVDRLHVRAGEGTLLLGLIGLLVTGVALMTLFAVPWVVWLGGVVSAGLVHAIGQPLATSLINHEVTDSERATVLSTASLVSGLYSGLLMLAVDPLSKIMPFGQVVMLMTGLTLLLAAYPFYRLLRKKD